MDGFVLPNLIWGHNRFLLVEELLCHPFLGMIAVVMVDEQDIALVNQPAHYLIFDGKTVNFHRPAAYQVKSYAYRSSPDQESVIIQFPDPCPLIDRVFFNFIDSLLQPGC
jgi:hypothetical protein